VAPGEREGRSREKRSEKGQAGRRERRLGEGEGRRGKRQERKEEERIGVEGRNKIRERKRSGVKGEEKRGKPVGRCTRVGGGGEGWGLLWNERGRNKAKENCIENLNALKIRYFDN